MANYEKMVVALLDPSNISKAGLASSPYVLRKIIAADPKIRTLISAGERIIPLIQNEVSKEDQLDGITLAAFAFIVESVRAEAAPEIFGKVFRKKVEDPDPFFVHFAAHAIRSGLRLPVKPLEMHYSRSELIETQNQIS